MSVFQTQNPWLLAAGAGNDVGRTYARTLVDLAQIKAARQQQLQEEAWRAQQAQIEQQQRAQALAQQQVQQAQAQRNWEQSFGLQQAQEQRLGQVAGQAADAQRLNAKGFHFLDDQGYTLENVSQVGSLLDPQSITKALAIAKANTSTATGVGGVGELGVQPLGDTGLFIGVKRNPDGEMTIVPGTLGRQTPSGYKLISDELPLEKQIAMWNDVIKATSPFGQGQEMLTRSNANVQVSELLKQLQGVPMASTNNVATNAPRLMPLTNSIPATNAGPTLTPNQPPMADPRVVQAVVQTNSPSVRRIPRPGEAIPMKDTEGNIVMVPPSQVPGSRRKGYTYAQ